MNYGQQDQTALRMQRVMGIPMGDGRVFKNGVVVSAGDAAAADADRARNATLDAQARGQAITPTAPIGMPTVPGSQVAGVSPGGQLPPAVQPVGPADPAYRAPVAPAMPGNIPGMPIDVTGYSGSRYDPNFAANNGIKPVDPNSQFIRQQLLAMNGTADGRVYTAATLAKATNAQVAGELAALKPRNDFLNDQVKRLGETSSAGKGFGSYEDAMKSVPTGTEAKATQDTKTGRWFVEASTGKQTGGFGTAAEAQSSIPAGTKGQVSQTAGGKWVVQYGVNDTPAAPDSPLAKLQTDHARAVKEGRTEDAAALQAKITAETSTEEKPFSVREFQAQPDLMKQYSMSYGKYLGQFNQLKAEKTGAATTPAAPVAVKTAAERDKLAAGTRYTAPDGKVYTKK